MGECVKCKKVFWRFNPRQLQCGALIVRREVTYTPSTASPTLGRSRHDAWAQFVLADPDKAADSFAVTRINLSRNKLIAGKLRINYIYTTEK